MSEKTKEQELIEEAIADKIRANEDEFKARVKTLLYNISTQQLAMREAAKKIAELKKSLSELKLEDIKAEDFK